MLWYESCLDRFLSYGFEKRPINWPIAQRYTPANHPECFSTELACFILTCKTSTETA